MMSLCFKMAELRLDIFVLFVREVEKEKTVSFLPDWKEDPFCNFQEVKRATTSPTMSHYIANNEPHHLL